MIQKSKTPRIAHRLNTGEIFALSDLPPAKTSRWVISRKRAVVTAIALGMLSEQEACDVYALSPEELSEWRRKIPIKT